MRDPVLADKRVRHAIGYAIDRQAIVDYLRRGLARPAIGPRAVAGLGLRAGRAAVRLRSGAGAGAAGRGRLSRPGRRRPAAAPAAVAQDARPTRKRGCSRPSSRRTCGAWGSTSTSAPTSSPRSITDVLKGRLPAVHAAVGRRRAGRSRHPAARVSLAPGAAGRVQSRLLPQPRGRSADRRGAAASTSDEERRELYSEVQRLVADDAAYIPIWNKTNVIVAQRSLAGLHLRRRPGDFHGRSRGREADRPATSR